MKLELEQAYAAATETERIRQMILGYASNVVRDVMAENNHLTLVEEGMDDTCTLTEVETIPQAS